MYALFEEGGKFLAGRLLSEAQSSVHFELDSGKRVKVKSANVLLRFDKPAPAELIAAAQRIALEIDLDLAWQFAPAEDFGFADLARDYFDASAGVEQQAAALFALFDAPHYFRRQGKGQFRKASEEIVKAALQGIARKQAVAAQVDNWASELVAGTCPAPVRETLYKILFKPDKNAAEYKAVVEASRRSQRAPLELLKSAGAVDSPYRFHWKRFLFENFPKGTALPALGVPALSEALPVAAVQAFSIDDSATTEIDDALSVTGLGSGVVSMGIHIAAPALAFAPESALDKVARERMSTVYMPGYKLTMLPDDVVQAFTLVQGRDCPAVSLYVSFDELTLEVRGSETRLERVPIAANLRHDQLDSVVTQASLSGTASAHYAFADELAFAFRLARHLKAGREVRRGKPENFQRPDYTFKLEGNDGREPQGSERVTIGQRQRGAPLDLIVAEAMILANSTWGSWLQACGVPAIYRSQASLAPGVKVRMGIRAAPHAGIGVAQYSWATSPLRRYVDLVNQWQIVACARHGRTAALAAPFKPKDVALFSIISGFDAAYAEYNAFQSAIERYWALKALAQEGITELDAVTLNDGLVRADAWPLVFRALGAEGLRRGLRVRVRVTGTDLLTLDLHAGLIAQIDAAPASTAANDLETDLDESPQGQDSAGPLSFAIDIAPDAAELEASLPADVD
ncbi:MAG: RNB domain-containing ribonuclease [Burkholderiaceae bacterium]